MPDDNRADVSVSPSAPSRTRSLTRKDVATRTFAKTMRHAETDAERRIWTILRDRRFGGFKFRRQVPIGRYIVDFVCFERKLIVEAAGSRHVRARATGCAMPG